MHHPSLQPSEVRDVAQLKTLVVDSDRGAGAMISTPRLSATAKLALQIIVCRDRELFGGAAGRIDLRYSYLQSACGFRRQMVTRALTELARKEVLDVDALDTERVRISVRWDRLAVLLGLLPSRSIMLTRGAPEEVAPVIAFDPSDEQKWAGAAVTARPMVRTERGSEHAHHSDAPDGASDDEALRGRRVAAIDNRAKYLSNVGRLRVVNGN